MKTFKTGDRVRFRSEDYDLHRLDPYFYPKAGTLGTITKIDGSQTAKVQWEHGSTSGDDEWWAAYNCLELVEE